MPVAAIDTLSQRLAPYEWGRAPDRARLALVGPVPPLGGGIGAYNARLLEALPSFAAVDLASWLFAALFALFGFCSAVKGTTERTTWRYVRWRKERRLRREMQALVRE